AQRGPQLAARNFLIVGKRDHTCELSGLKQMFVLSVSYRLTRLSVPPSHAHAETRRYSVLISLSPSSAALSVCQLSDAHLTRAGNSRTPAKILSLPSWFSSASMSKPPVTIR